MPLFRLTVTLDTATNQVNVEGPLEQRLLCFGLLEEAKKVISEFVPKQQPMVVPASVIPTRT